MKQINPNKSRLLLLFDGIRGFSSSGRAPALQAGGERFDPVNLHQDSLSEMMGWVVGMVEGMGKVQT